MRGGRAGGRACSPPVRPPGPSRRVPGPRAGDAQAPAAGLPWTPPPSPCCGPPTIRPRADDARPGRLAAASWAGQTSFGSLVRACVACVRVTTSSSVPARFPARWTGALHRGLHRGTGTAYNLWLVRAHHHTPRRLAAENSSLPRMGAATVTWLPSCWFCFERKADSAADFLVQCCIPATRGITTGKDTGRTLTPNSICTIPRGLPWPTSWLAHHRRPSRRGRQCS